MACSSLSSVCPSNQAFCTHKLFHYPKIKAQSFRDNGMDTVFSFCSKEVQNFNIQNNTLINDFTIGKPTNIVDANLNVLRERILQVRKRKSLINTCGWNYKHDYDYKYKRDAIISESAEIMGLACGAIGLVFLIGSLLICLVSLFVHM